MSINSTISPIDLNLSAPLEQARRAASAAPSQVDAGGASFAEALADAGEGLVTRLNTAEAASIRGINGDATSYEVASAVMEAEQALRMAVAVREKVISAYLEISRMQI